MQRLSKGFYVSAPIVALVSVTIIIAVLVVVFATSTLNDITSGAIILIVLAAFGVIYASIVNFVFIYKIWDAIADEYARTTAGKAVGFLFIPFFNLYWIFQVLWGFAKDCNSYIERHSINTEKLPEGLFLACAVLQVAGVIPYLGILCSLASLVLLAIAVSKACDAVNAFDQVKGEKGGTLSLYFVSGEFANDSLELPPNGLTMGRDPQKANLIFNSAKISSLHAKLTPTGQGQVLVEDLNSLNGTFYRQRRAGAQIVGWDWVQFRGQMLFDAGARLRLADGVSEFEVRKQ